MKMKDTQGCTVEVDRLIEDAKQLTCDEMQKLKQVLEAELRSREADQQPQIIYTHDCWNASKYHRNKYKHWAKHIHSVDTTKLDGYAFIGDWLQVERENYVPSGAIVVEVCENDFTCYRIAEDGKVTVASAYRNGEFSSFVAAVDEALREG
jgi:hypothetical protein